MMGILKDLDASHCNCPYGAAGKEVLIDLSVPCRVRWATAVLERPWTGSMTSSSMLFGHRASRESA